MSIDWQSIQRKWINAWDESRIFESDPIDGKPKYFITVAKLSPAYRAWENLYTC